DQGLSILADLQADMAARGTKVLNGQDAFKLYDTYGFPIDLTKEILEEKGLSVDEEGFEACMQEQRETARKARKTTNYMGADVTVFDTLDPEVSSKFVGYDSTCGQGKVLYMTRKGEDGEPDALINALADGDQGTIVLDQTTLYATMGGQEADTGMITKDGAAFQVMDTVKLPGGKIGHVGTVTEGMFAVGDTVTSQADQDRRADTAKNHSATHLLHAALRQVLGTHVNQKGSLVNGDHLRFDFSHFQAMTPEEISRVEEIVNEEIAAGLPVHTDVMKIDDAKKTGAMALFDEKYEDDVRVVSMGDFSKELCGGTHVSNTASIGSFKILSENGISAGVRRIEALTGRGLAAYYKKMEETLAAAAKAARTDVSQLESKIESMQAEIKALSAENESLKNKLAQGAMGDVMDQVKEVKGVKVLAVRADGVDGGGLRNLGDQLKEKLGEGVIVIASEKDGKVNLIAMATDQAQKAGAHAGNLIKGIATLVGGGGGGRPGMAQAGGKNPAGIDAALAKAAEVVEGQIK
ncbi:MAG: alanine--tRNA ligase, partial [Lachnospiraceae bacterium]|nr:alanine--tRNA ligase [Lachnospiraceae bacterium]